MEKLSESNENIASAIEAVQIDTDDSVTPVSEPNQLEQYSESATPTTVNGFVVVEATTTKPRNEENDDEEQTKFYLRSMDDVDVTTSLKVIKMSNVLEQMLGLLDDQRNDASTAGKDTVGRSAEHPLKLDVTGDILQKVVAWCNQYKEDPPKPDLECGETVPTDDINDWDTEFLTNQPQQVLFDLILAADRLHIPGLLDLSCKNVVNLMRGKTAEEIRDLFDIENDLPKEEEEKIRAENAWYLDD